MNDRESAPDIDEAAADWAAKTSRDLTHAEQVDLDRWLAGDSRRLGAFVRAQAAWIHAERAGALGSYPDTMVAWAGDNIAAPIENPRRHPTRRMMLAGGGAVAASVVAVGAMTFNRARTIESGIGEIRSLTLADGSHLTLDTDTRIEIAHSSDDRKISLVRGKMFLDVVTDETRSMLVDANGLAMQMSEGAFDLQALVGTPLVAVVTAGRLMVSQRVGLFGSSRSITLGQDDALTLPDGASLVAGLVRRIGSEKREQLLAWRDGMLSFGGETLANAVRAFDRYGPVRIVVADPDLAAQPITGLFKGADPRGFATAIAASFGAVVRGDGNLVRIIPQK